MAHEKSSMPQCSFCSLSQTGRNHHTGVLGSSQLGKTQILWYKTKQRLCRMSLVLSSACAHTAVAVDCHCWQRSDPRAGLSLLPNTGVCPLLLRGHCSLLYPALSTERVPAIAGQVSACAHTHVHSEFKHVLFSVSVCISLDNYNLSHCGFGWVTCIQNMAWRNPGYCANNNVSNTSLM